MNKNKSIIYVNFAPYENAGKILDFLKEEFNMVLLFSFDFHKLTKSKRKSNYLTLFKKNKIIKHNQLFKLPSSEALLFITLPIVAIIIGIQTIWHTYRIVNIFGVFDFYLSVNAFTVWIGNILKKLRLLRKTIFWVWDYFPPGYPDIRIRLARWAYWKFDKVGTEQSDKVIFLNRRLETFRKKIDVLPKNSKFTVIPIGTNPKKNNHSKSNIIGHLGVLKKSQGLDILFDTLEKLNTQMKISVEIIGEGPELPYFKNRAKPFDNVRFLGFISNYSTVDSIIKKWGIGLAPYIPEKSNGAYWTDPSKIKAYIGQSVPVITTNVSGFAGEIKKADAGIIIDYHKPDQLVEAVRQILNHNTAYKNNAYKLAQKYYYKTIYRNLFL